MRMLRSEWPVYLNALIVVYDATLGISDLVHHRVLPGLFFIFLAVGLALVTALAWRSRRRAERAIEELRRQMNERRTQAMLQNPVERLQAETKAITNLNIIAKAVGAKLESGGYAFIKGGKKYLVQYRAIYILSTEGQPRIEAATCYTRPVGQPNIPHAEVIASALLLLHHNPNIFKKWKSQKGWHS